MDTAIDKNFCGPLPDASLSNPENASQDSPENLTGTPIEPDESTAPDVDASIDLAQPQLPVDEPETPVLQRMFATIKFIGAATIAAAMALFLFEGIEVTNDIQRFSSILGFAGFLTVLGLAVNKWLSDRVASRLFIGLALLSVPVIATVLGGFTFSLTPAAASLALPQYATWKLASTASLVIALPVALVIVGAVSAFGLMVMARSESRWLTPALIASNALLLIPTRDSTTVALIASVAIVTLLWIVRKYQQNPISFKTFEGQWALAVLFIAPVIMIVRSAVFYEPEIVSATVIAVTLYAVSRYIFHRVDSGKKREIFALLATVVSGFLAVVCLIGFGLESSLIPFVNYNGTAGTVTLIWTLMMLGVAFDFARKNNSWILSRLMNGLTIAAVGIVVLSSGVFIEINWIATLVLFTILAAFMPLYYGRGWNVETGILLVVIAGFLLLHIDDIFRALMATGWWGLAAAGTAAVVGSAVLEKSLKRQPKPA